MGLADEFTAEMAKYITQKEDTSQILQALTAQNAFVTRLSDGKTFRFHHMMKECAKRNFLELDREKQVVYYNRYGRWYEIHKLYIHALSAYWNSENYDAMLRVVQEDAGILLASAEARASAWVSFEMSGFHFERTSTCNTGTYAKYV